MKPSIKSLRLVLAALPGAILGTSCATVGGMGRDVERAGNNIQKAGR